MQWKRDAQGRYKFVGSLYCKIQKMRSYSKQIYAEKSFWFKITFFDLYYDFHRVSQIGATPKLICWFTPFISVLTNEDIFRFIGPPTIIPEEQLSIKYRHQHFQEPEPAAITWSQTQSAHFSRTHVVQLIEGTDTTWSQRQSHWEVGPGYFLRLGATEASSYELQ